MALGNNIKNDQLIPAAEPEPKKGTKNSRKTALTIDDQFSQILQALSKSQGIIEFNLDGTIITANENFLHLLGYTLAEVQGKHHRIFCLENYANSLAYKKFWENLNKGRFDAAQYMRVGKNGREVWIQATYNPILDEKGKPYKVIKFATDITEQKKMEADIQHVSEQLKAQEQEIRHNMEELQTTQEEMGRKQVESNHLLQRFNLVTKTTTEGVWDMVVPSNMEFKDETPFWWADRFRQMLGYTNEQDFPNRLDSWANLLHPDHKEQTLAAFNAHLMDFSGKTPYDVEYQLLLKNGQYKWFRAVGNTLRDIHGKPLRVAGTLIDIQPLKDLHTFQQELESKVKERTSEMEILLASSHKQAEEMQATQEEAVRKQIELDGQIAALNNAAIVSEVDLKGNILSINDEFCRLAKYTREELIGQKQSIVRHPDMPAAIFDDLWATITKGKVWRGEVKNRAKDGSHYWVAATITPVLNELGRPVKYIGVRFDITAQKEQEEKIKQNVEQMQKAVDVQRANLLGFGQATKFIQELTLGNFNAQMNVEGLDIDENVSGVISNLNFLRNTLKEIISEVNQVVKLAGEEGKLNARLNVKDTKGEWKQLLDSMNSLLASVSEPVLEFNSIIAEMAKGDLTNKFQMKVNGDIMNMANSLNTAISNLNNLLSTIGVSSDVVADSSKGMMKKSESMKNNTTEVASAISQMAKGAQEQAVKTDASSKLVEEVLKSANTMEQKANVINKAAEKGQKGSEDGLKIVKRLVENMGEIGESAKKTSGSIDILTQRAEEIARTLNVITDIAAQTNLLALNAAIEAARAGDAGRGFAVVAEEIRKLAEDSRRSAVDIEKIIKDVQKDTMAAGKAIETMQSSVKLGDNASKEAESIFQEIAKSSNETFSFSKEIQEATSEQKSSISAVVKNIEQIVVVAEETAAGTQQVASSSQQLNQGMNDITESSSKLSQVAAELQAGVSKFKLKK